MVRFAIESVNQGIIEGEREGVKVDFLTLFSVATDLSVEDMGEILDKIDKRARERNGILTPSDFLEIVKQEREVLEEFFKLCADILGVDVSKLKLRRLSEFAYLCFPS